MATTALIPIDPEAPAWLHAGAQAILVGHISGGGLALLSGAVALSAPKGGRLHRRAGNVFFVAMLAMAGIGAVVALYLNDFLNSIAGFTTLYFLATGWATARKRKEGVGAFEIAALLYALAAVSTAGVLAITASETPDGGWIPFYIFSAIIVLAALCDLKVILHGGISGAERVARHVWRICFALFVATLSFFLGQAEIFPAPLRESFLILVVLALAPLGFLVFWMLRVRLSRKWRGLPNPPRKLTPTEQNA